MASAFINDPVTGERQRVLLLSTSEWNDLQYQINKKDIEERRDAARAKELEEKKNLTLSMAQDWPNTPNKLRLEHLAVEQAKVGRTKKIKDIRYNKAVEENKKFEEGTHEKIEEERFLETDDAKNFISALRYAEALRQQQAQQKFEKALQEKVSKKDQEYVESIKADVEKYKKEQEEEEKEKLKNAIKLKDEYYKMITEAEQKRLKEKKDRQEEEVKELENIKNEIEQIEKNEKMEV